MNLEHLGIILGFLGALCNASNYAFSKDCVEKFGLRGIRQLIVVHVSLFILMIPFIFLFDLVNHLSTQVILDTVYIIVPYLIAQYLLIMLLPATGRSVVSPLLTLKMPVVAGISFIFVGQVFEPKQIFSVALIIMLGFYFSSLSGKIKLMPLMMMFLICLGYAGADYGTVIFMHHYEGTTIEKGIAVIVWQYVILGLIAIPLMFLVKPLHLHPIHINQCKWATLSWLAGTFCWVGCFYLAGVVEGNIIQSLRCVIGVLIAYIFYRKYIKDPNTFKKKLFISAGMFTAVFIYYI